MNASIPGTVELNQIRADLAAVACDLPCTISRFDAVGTKTYGVVSPADLKVGIAEPSASMRGNYDYIIGDAATWHVRFPYGTVVKELDLLNVTMPEGMTRKLNVVKLLRPRSYEFLVSALATE